MNRLYRSRRDRFVTGLCGGLAESFGINLGILRLLTVIAIPFSGGAIIFIYLIASLVIPKEPYQPPYDPYFNQGWQPGYGPGPGSYDNRRDRRYSQRPPYGDPFAGQTPPPPPFSNDERGRRYNSSSESSLDSMMGDIEKKAMKKELEELRKKVAKYEKGEE